MVFTFALCKEFSLSDWVMCHTGAHSKEFQLEDYLTVVRLMIENPLVRRKDILNHIVTEACTCTNSRAGFLCQLFPDGTTENMAITNTAWNLSSYNFYEEFKGRNENLHTFLAKFSPNKFVVENRCVTDSWLIGHPPITKYAVMPQQKNNSVFFLVVCNKRQPYKKTDENALRTLLTLGILTLL